MCQLTKCNQRLVQLILHEYSELSVHASRLKQFPSSKTLKILFCRNLQRRSVVSRGLHDRRVHWRHRRKSHLHALPLRKYMCTFAHPIRAFMTSFGFRFTTKSIKCRWRKSIKSRDIQTASWSGKNSIRAWELLFVLWSDEDLFLYPL